VSEDKTVPFSKQINIPPVWLVGTLLVMWLWHTLLPIVSFGGTWAKTLGALLIVASMGLGIWSAVHFVGADTPIHPRRKPTSLLTTGPFAFSRNPIYLAVMGVALGAALCFGSVGALIPIIGLFWVLSDLFIKGEEFHIEKNFGEEFKAYTAKTRRWL